jgi:hypothetical protein
MGNAPMPELVVCRIVLSHGQPDNQCQGQSLAMSHYCCPSKFSSISADDQSPAANNGVISMVQPQGNVDDAADLRPAESLAQQARMRLRQSVYPAVRQVSCECHGTTVVLSGKVTSYFEKQLTQTLVLAILQGAAELDNQVEVNERAQ